MSIGKSMCGKAHRNRVRFELELAFETLNRCDHAAYLVLLAQAWAFVVENSGCSEFPSILA